MTRPVSKKVAGSKLVGAVGKKLSILIEISVYYTNMKMQYFMQTSSESVILKINIRHAKFITPLTSLVIVILSYIIIYRLQIHTIILAIKISWRLI